MRMRTRRQMTGELTQMNGFVPPAVKQLVLLERVRTHRTIGDIVSECVLAHLAPDHARVNRATRTEGRHATPTR